MVSIGFDVDSLPTIPIKHAMIQQYMFVNLIERICLGLKDL